MAQQYVDGKQFADSNEVLLSALELWSEFESYYQEGIRKRLEVSTDQAEAGEAIVLRTDRDIDEYANSVLRGT